MQARTALKPLHRQQHAARRRTAAAAAMPLPPPVRPLRTPTTPTPTTTRARRDAAPAAAAAASSTAARASRADAASATDGATARYFSSADPRPIVLYDGVCNMCNGAVDLMLRLDPGGRFRLAALQSPAGRTLLARSGRAPDDISSIVLVDREGFYVRSEAVRRIAAGLGFPPIALAAALARPVPLPLRDAAYDVIADNRYSIFGRTDACRLEDRSARREFEERFVTY